MKPSIVACLLVAAVQADPTAVVRARWASFKAQHGKTYEPHEEDLRFSNFLQTTKQIEEHNARFHAGEVSYHLRHNQYSDLSASEFKNTILGRNSFNAEGWNITRVPPSSMRSIPESVDWRKRGIVSPVKNQGHCGSCYAFSALGVLESAIAQSTFKILDLSEQQIVDCSYHIHGHLNRGCAGGSPLVVMHYINRRGVVTEHNYPYTSGKSRKRNSCQRNSGSFGKNLEYFQVPANDERNLAAAIAQHGTMIMFICGRNPDFYLYGGGIYDNPACSKKVSHAVSVVGYGSENGKDFWIIKNSWGTRWGENGYMRIRRGVNMCGVASQPAFGIKV